MKIKLEKTDKNELHKTNSLPSPRITAAKIKRHRSESIPKSRSLRPLVRKEISRKYVESTEKVQNKFVSNRMILVSMVFIIAAIVLYQSNRCKFWATYNKNYYKAMYGDEFYCFGKINTSLMTERLHEQIINQNDAIQLIEGSLKMANQESFIQMIFHGNTGVGKSLASAIIANNFQWKENVQKLVWHFHQKDVIMAASSRLSKCGFNLIILDDLDASDESLEFVKLFEDDLRRVAKEKDMRVILVNIFKAPLNDARKNELSTFVIIDFEAFTEDGLLECIKLHQKLNNIVISEREMNELKAINFTDSGCKQVSKRLNLIESKYK